MIAGYFGLSQKFSVCGKWVVLVEMVTDIYIYEYVFHNFAMFNYYTVFGLITSEGDCLGFDLCLYFMLVLYVIGNRSNGLCFWKMKYICVDTCKNTLPVNVHVCVTFLWCTCTCTCILLQSLYLTCDVSMFTANL